MSGSYIGGSTIIRLWEHKAKQKNDRIDIKNDKALLNELFQQLSTQGIPKASELSELVRLLRHVTYNDVNLQPDKEKLEPDDKLIRDVKGFLGRNGKRTFKVFTKTKAKAMFEEREMLEILRHSRAKELKEKRAVKKRSR